ncbi:MBL fold metallo-hydrolase [Pseudidiomarina aestuarii]|uniref:MBL fold metallo-hydrolase n=1 Tax=Pseudidiomarina aestuarii TaxID=624146 RepID=A0A6N4DFM4_9GAMM|nr:MBL fold metallo-hydrolase [Pseudidiomarina aestuarii]
MKQVLTTAGVIVSLTLSSTVAAMDESEGDKQAPGFYRMTLGDFKVTAISDGTVTLPVHDLLHMDADAVQQRLAEDFLASPLETSVNGYLVDTGEQQILIDTGAGALFGPTLGFFRDNLWMAGYKPEDIDMILITHMHPDHVGGLMHEGEKVFSQATVYVDADDADFWLSEANLNAAAESDKGFFQGAQASLLPYRDSNQLVTFADGDELVSGITVNPTPGHTPGHSVYHVESQGETLVVWGDIMHVASVQFEDPTVTIAFDTNSEQAFTQRQRIFEEVAEQGYWAAGAHVAFPGIGHLREEEQGYRWVPINYSTQL